MTFCLFTDSEDKIDKIKEYLRTIDERLGTLKDEKEELKEYQKWDRMRRSLEYCIHDRELKDTKRKLDEVNNAYPAEVITLELTRNSLI